MSKLDWQTVDRSPALIATRENMRKVADVPGVFVLDTESGDEWASSDGDYFMLSDSEPLTSQDGTPCILVARRTYFINPLTGEPSAANAEEVPA